MSLTLLLELNIQCVFCTLYSSEGHLIVLDALDELVPWFEEVLVPIEDIDTTRLMSADQDPGSGSVVGGAPAAVSAGAGATASGLKVAK